MKQAQFAANAIKINTNKKIRELKISFTEQIEDLQEKLAEATIQLNNLRKFPFTTPIGISNDNLKEDYANYVKNSQLVIKEQQMFKWKSKNRTAIKEDQRKAKELAQE